MLKLIDIKKSFGEKTVLNGVSLTIDDGQTLCIMGASGGGKTTLMRIACGLILPDSGSVIFDYKKKSCVFQENRLLPWYDALKNITCMGVSPDIAANYLQKVGLSGEEHTLPASLSGGMQRRLALARALAYGGDMFFLDEPFTGLDEGTKEDIISLLEQELSGKTALMVTHDAAAAQRLGDKIINL